MLTYAPSKPVGGRQRRRLEAKRDTAIAHVSAYHADRPLDVMQPREERSRAVRRL